MVGSGRWRFPGKSDVRDDDDDDVLSSSQDGCGGWWRYSTGDRSKAKVEIGLAMHAADSPPLRYNTFPAIKPELSMVELEE
jgi:hypothetical protein